MAWSIAILEITGDDFKRIGLDIKSIPPDLFEDIVDALKFHYNEYLNFRKNFKKIVTQVMEKPDDEDFDDHNRGGRSGHLS